MERDGKCQSCDQTGAIVVQICFADSPLLLVALSRSPRAEKRPVTIDDVTATHSPRAGSGADPWAPDGKRFAFREGNSIWQYDVQSKLKKEIVSLIPLREKAVKPSPAEAFDWQNRRVAESSYQWSRSGAEMLVERRGRPVPGPGGYAASGSN